MPILVEHGCDISGTTAQRPANASAGQHFYDTTLGAWLVHNGSAWEPVSADVSMSTVAAAGADQSGAAALVAGFNLVTDADGAKGVKLPTAAASVVVEGYNNSASALLVYPNTSDDINDGTVNVAVSVAAHTAFRFVATDAVTWAGDYAPTGTTVTLTGAETLTNKTLTSPVLNALPKFQNTVTPVAAAGSTVSDAGQLASTMVNHVTSDSAAKGVKFWSATQNQLAIVINNSSTACELYAASGGTVNGLSADASVVIPASKGVLAFCTGTNTWIVFDLPAKATAS